MDEFSQKIAQIKQLAEDPTAMSGHIANQVHDLDQSLPMTAQSLSNVITNGAQFLNSKIPQAKVKLALSSKYEPSDVQKQKFNRYYDAVDNPIDILKEVKRGTLTAEHMEALQAVHPELLNEMRQKIISHADPERAKKLPYHIQKGLSMFLGQPVHESMLPQVGQANQAIFQANQIQKAQQNQQMMGKSTQKGLSELSISKRAETATQKDESGSAGK